MSGFDPKAYASRYYNEDGSAKPQANDYDELLDGFSEGLGVAKRLREEAAHKREFEMDLRERRKGASPDSAALCSWENEGGR